MTNIAQHNLHFELSDKSSNNCFKTVISKGFTPYSKHLNLLKITFEEEVEKNLQELNNFHGAYKYIMETLFKFESLGRYYFPSVFSNHFLKKCCKKTLGLIDETTKDIVLFMKNINSMICDFLLLKCDLLKQLKDEYFRKPVSPSFNSKWSKSIIDLIELAKLLKESKIVEGRNGKLSLKDIVNDLATIFGIEVKSLYSKVSKAKDRKILLKPTIYQIMEDYIKDN